MIYLGAFFNFIVAASAGVGAFVAIQGLDAWKKQMKGKTDYELARRYLRSVYKVRDALKNVRNPFISSDEMFVALSESGLSPDDYKDRQKTNRAVYAKRWDEVKSAVSDYEVELAEAEVSWGKELIDLHKAFDNCRKKLYVAIKMFLEGHYLDTQHKMIYDSGDQDEFNIEMDASISKIEEYLKPHLK